MTMGYEIVIKFFKATETMSAYWAVMDQRQEPPTILAKFEKRIPAAIHRHRLQEQIDAPRSSCNMRLRNISDLLAQEMAAPDQSIETRSWSERHGFDHEDVLAAIDWGVQYGKFKSGMDPWTFTLLEV